MTNNLSHTNTEDKLDLTFEGNMGLVYKAAKGYTGRGCEFEDLVQLGSIGLIKAIKRFDKSYGVCFSTYAFPLIVGEIRRFLRDDGIIKVSRSVKENAAKGLAAREKIKKETGEEPTISDISKCCGVACEDLVYAFEACSEVGSIDDEAVPLPKSGTSLEEEAINKICVSQMISKLPPRERQIIVMRYITDKTQSYIAAKLGISQVQVSRLEKKALLFMRENMKM